MQTPTQQCDRETVHQKHIYGNDLGQWSYCPGLFPAPPTQEDRDVSQAEPVSTRRGHFDVPPPIPETQRRVLPNYMQQSVNGDALMQRLGAAVSVDDDGTVEDRPSVWSRQILADVLRASKTVLNVHAVSISDKHLHCIASCSGPLPHVSEYRAADVRPPAEQTARNNAADANKPLSSNKN